jgi:biotin operon repressor
MAESKREFKGVWFPAQIWLDERLTALEKIILIEIDSLDGEDGCYASNEYLAGFCQCSQTKVSSAISKLKKLGYVKVASFDGRRRVLHSCIVMTIGETDENCKSPLHDSVSQTYKNCESPSQNLEQRVLVETPRETTNNNGRKRVRKPFVPPTIEEVQAHVEAKGYHFDARQFFDYYEASNWHFKSGKPVRNWKQCCVTWEGNHHSTTREQGRGRNDAYNF